MLMSQSWPHWGLESPVAKLLELDAIGRDSLFRAVSLFALCGDKHGWDGADPSLA